MAATVGATISVGEQTSGMMNPGTMTIPHTIDAGTTVLLVGVVIPVESKNIASITWDGNAMELEHSTNFGTDLVGVHRISVYSYTFPTGSGDVVVTLTAGTNAYFGVTILNLLGVLPASFDASSSLDSGTETMSATAPSSDIEVGCLLVDFVLMGGIAGLTVGAGQTVADGRGTNDANGSVGGSDFGCSYRLVSDPVALDMEWSHVGALDWGLVAAHVHAYHPPIVRMYARERTPVHRGVHREPVMVGSALQNLAAVGRGVALVHLEGRPVK